MVDVRGTPKFSDSGPHPCSGVGIPGFSRGGKRISGLPGPVMSARMFRLRRRCCCVPDQEPLPAVGAFEVHGEILGCLRRPEALGCAVAPRIWSRPGGMLDHRELVQARPGQRDRLQEVARRQDIGLGAQEVCPVCSGSAFRRRVDPSSWRISQTVEATALQRRPGHSGRGHQRLRRLLRRPRMQGDRVGAADILRRLVRPCTAHLSAHEGGSVPACSLTRYRAYQSGQFGSSAPMRVSCSP